MVSVCSSSSDEGLVTHVSDEILDNVSLTRRGGGLDCILEQLVLLRQCDRLLPTLILAVNVGGDLAEEDQVMLLQAASQLDSVVVVVILDRVAERLVVLFLDEQVVDGLVDDALVL